MTTDVVSRIGHGLRWGFAEVPDPYRALDVQLERIFAPAALADAVDRTETLPDPRQ